MCLLILMFIVLQVSVILLISCVSFMSVWVSHAPLCTEAAAVTVIKLVYGVCGGKSVHVELKTLPTFSLFVHVLCRQHHHSSSVCLGAAESHSHSEWQPLQKVFVVLQSRGFIPSLWLPNEALYCLIPSTTCKNQSKEGLAVFHQGWWASVHVHMSGWGFLLEPA